MPMPQPRSRTSFLLSIIRFYNKTSVPLSSFFFEKTPDPENNSNELLPT